MKKAASVGDAAGPPLRPADGSFSVRAQDWWRRGHEPLPSGSVACAGQLRGLMSTVTTDNATIAIQSGNVAKHIHPKTDEIQYVLRRQRRDVAWQ
jgi:hypothetical protein